MMNLYDIPLFGMLRVKMSWLGDRQRVLAENIANSSTVGYQAKDLRKLSFDDLLKRSQDLSNATSGIKLTGGVSGNPDGDFTEETARDGAMSPNGNSVILEQQMMKVTETQVQYQAAIDLYRKGLNMLRLAIDKQ
jgi:flagellar basal-body rod protein FlgB